MAFRTKIVLCAAFLVLSATFAAHGERVATSLTAEVMDYDVETGDFKAQGNVKLQREGVTLESAYGTANTQTQKACVWDKVHAYGVYNGEKLDARCAQLDADFAVDGGEYVMTGNVDATFGARVLRSDMAKLAGQTFAAENVRHFEDKSRNLVLSCSTLTGDYDGEGLRVADGTGPVVVTQDDKDKNSRLWCDSFAYRREEDRLTGSGGARILVTQKADKNKVTDIRCDTLVYSFKAGSVTASGNARAVQDGRRVSAKNLIYFPETGKLEAKGKPTITVDLTPSGQKTPAKQPSRTGNVKRSVRRGGK